MFAKFTLPIVLINKFILLRILNLNFEVVFLKTKKTMRLTGYCTEPFYSHHTVIENRPILTFSGNEKD